MIDLQNEIQGSATKGFLTLARVRRWAAHALALGVKDHEITIRVVDETEARALNREFRKKDYATNVLTFDYSQTPLLAADIVLCAPVIAKEAVQQGKTLEAHWAHLIIHGVLHAQGYEHETNERDALEMEALEVLLLSALGYPNPY
jgi:probable rRNA maturation factor